MEPLGVILFSGRPGYELATSALPDAPVVPYQPVEPRFGRYRAALAGALSRLATVVAPAGWRSESPAGPALRTESSSGGGRWDASPCRRSPTVSA
jgi:hypothetical protein